MVLQINIREYRCKGKYERLVSTSDEKAGTTVRARGFLMKRGNGGRVKGLKLSRARKLNWKPFSIFFMLSKKIGKMYGDAWKRLMKMDEAYPAIVFSSQWGLPVVSHNYSVNRRNKINNSVPCYKSLTWL